MEPVAVRPKRCTCTPFMAMGRGCNSIAPVVPQYSHLACLTSVQTSDAHPIVSEETTKKSLTLGLQEIRTYRLLVPTVYLSSHDPDSASRLAARTCYAVTLNSNNKMRSASFCSR